MIGLFVYETAQKLIDAGESANSGGILLDAGGGTGRVAEALHSLAGSVIVADLSFLKC